MSLAFIYCIFMTKWLFPALAHTKKMKIWSALIYPNFVPNLYAVMTSVTNMNTIPEMCRCCPLVGVVCTIFSQYVHFHSIFGE